MNTVFKFYVQAWALLAMGGAAAVYIILFGDEDRRRFAPRTGSAEQGTPVPAAVPAEAVVAERVQAANDVPVNMLSQPIPSAESAVDGSGGTAQAWERTGSAANWLVWTNGSADTAPSSAVPAGNGADDAAQYDAQDHVHNDSPHDIGTRPAVAVLAHDDSPTATVLRTSQQKSGSVPRRMSRLRVGWAVAFCLVLAAMVVPVLPTASARVNDRFPGQRPPIGTLDGLAYMEVGTFTTDVAPFPINLKYDLDAIRWLNNNLRGQHVLAEAPIGYYREMGMRGAANTGFPMVVGGLHQDEQRYGWLVGDRHKDMNEFFNTPDIQHALAIMSKHDIDYIYLGQLEQARAGDEGMAKFTQMAGPDVGILDEVFRSEGPSGVKGTIIYQVVKDSKEIAGAPLEGSGIPGVSITPMPTSTPTPMPTPPVDDPILKALIDDVVANPLDRDKRIKLVDWYRERGYWVDAARELETIVSQDPLNVAARHMLGDTYQAGGQSERALRAWEEARDVDTNNPAARNKVGIAYQERRRYDDAAREFEAAVASDPRFVESWFHLGQVFEAKGDRDRAKRAYQKAVENSPDENSWKQSAKERLSNLK